MESPKFLLQIYYSVQAILDNHSEHKKIGDGKTVVKDFRDLKKFKKEFD